MALQHASPASCTLTTGRHGRSSAAVLRRPPTDSSSRRLRLHAQKPAAGAETTATSSSSRSENAVLKTAWYGSELLGIAASLFRPAPSSSSPEGDAAGGGDVEGGAAAGAALDRAGVIDAVKADFARSYFVTGNLTLRAYEEDCEFADPAGSFRGLRRFKRNCTNFGSLLEKSNMKLTKWEDLEQPGSRNTTSMLNRGRCADFGGGASTGAICWIEAPSCDQCCASVLLKVKGVSKDGSSFLPQAGYAVTYSR